LCEKEFAKAQRIARVLGGDVQAPIPGSMEEARAVWDLFKKPAIPRDIRIVLGSTFDRVVLMHEDDQEFIKAVKAYSAVYPAGHLLGMADAMLKPPANTLGWCWNQTSVGSAWRPPSGKSRANLIRDYKGVAWNLMDAVRDVDKQGAPDA
jgi:hypothetical protein